MSKLSMMIDQNRKKKEAGGMIPTASSALGSSVRPVQRQETVEQEPTSKLGRAIQSARHERSIRTGQLQQQDNDFNTWLGDVQSFSQRVSGDYTKRQGTYQAPDTFRAYQEKAGSEIDDLLKRANAAKDYYTQYGKAYDEVRGADSTAKLLEGITQNIDYLEGIRTSLQSEGDWWGQFKDQDEFDEYQRYKGYTELPQAEDFEENSRYRSTRKSDEEIKDSRGPLSFLVPETKLLDYGDIDYDYINKDPEAMEKRGASDASSGLSALGLDDSERLEMDDKEIAIFNYLYATRSPEEAYQYVKDLTGELNFRQRKTAEEEWGQYASEHPVGASAFSVLTSPAKGLSYLGQVADYVSDGEIDQNAGYNKFSYIPSAIRGQVAQDITTNVNESKIGQAYNSSPIGKFIGDKLGKDLGEAASVLYETGMSNGDFLLNAALSGGSKATSFALFMSGAAADRVISDKDRGTSDNRAFILGSIAGLIEGFTEKFSLETLLKPDWEKGVMNYILKNAVAEGSEEGMSDVLNFMADAIYDHVTGENKSEFADSVRNYIDEGYSEEEATERARADWFNNLLWDMAGGALSGGIMSGVAGAGHVVNNYRAGRQIGSMDLSVEDIQTFIDEGLASDPSTQAYKLAMAAQQKLAAGGKLTNYELGNLYQANVRAVGMEEDGAELLKQAAAEVAEGKRMSNREAKAILESPSALRTLTEEAGLELTEDMSKSQQRSAVREAIARYQTGAETVTDGKGANRQAFGGLEQEQAGRDTSVVRQAWDQRRVEEFSGTLGKAGENVLRQMYDPTSGDTEGYISAMTAFYNAGMQGENMAQTYERVSGEYGEAAFPLTAPQAQAAYLAGQADRGSTAQTTDMQATTTEEVQGHEQESVHLREGGQRTDGTDPGRSLPAVEGRAGQNQNGRLQGRPADEGARTLNYGKTVTTASLGIGGGSGSDSIRVVTGGDTEHTARARAIAKERGLRLTLFAGANLSIQKGGAAEYASVRGYVTGDRVFIRADHPEFTADQIMRHEAGHDRIAKGEIDPDAVRERISRELGEEKAGELAGLYEAAYRGSGLSAEQIWEEVVCDSLGDMNVFSGTIHEEQAEELLGETGKASAAESETAKVRGPPQMEERGKLSIEFDRNNKPYVVIEEDILSGVPKSRWVKTVKDNLREKFPDGVTVGRNVISINKQSREEMTFSRYTRHLMQTEPDIFADKLRATNNADEILRAARSWVNEALLHPRTDDIIDFSRGEVLLRIGGNDYRAQVIVGSRNQRGLLLYDIIGLEPTAIEGKKTKSDTAIAGDPSLGIDRSTVSGFDTSISKTGEDVNGKFSMELPVEETKDLLALHNLTEDKLLKSLALGGFPMPSIAVTKTTIPHTNFGEITLVMDKSTIDPQFDWRNMVYSADAWTPTFPATEYEVNEKVAEKLHSKYYELFRAHGRDAVDALYPWGNYPEDLLNRLGGEKSAIANLQDDTDMMKVYLVDKGMQVPEPVVTETVQRMSDGSIALSEYLISKLGEDVVLGAKSDGRPPMIWRKEWYAEHGEALEDAYRSFMRERGFSDEQIENVMEHTRMGELVQFVTDARRYLNNGPETRTSSVDTAATQQAIRDAVDQDAYRAWLNDLFGGIEKSSGIYNGKERYTNSGDLRSFKALHLPVTLDNITKVMAAEGDGDNRNVAGFYGVKSLRASTAERFSSIKNMHELEGRLKNLTEEESSQITDALQERLYALMDKVYNSKPHSQYSNQLMDMDAIGNILMEAARAKKITIDSIIKEFSGSGYKISTDLAAGLRDLLFDISQMPVNLFEAKPERSVHFDEVLAAVIPDTSSDELRSKLAEVGVKTLEYAAGDDAARLEQVNSVEGAKFSQELENVEALKKENRELRARVEYWKGQNKLTTERTPDGASVRALARELIGRWQSELKPADIEGELESVWKGLNQERADSGRLKELASTAARKLVETARAEAPGPWQDYQDAAEYLRTVKLRVTPDLAGELESRGGYGEFRKDNFGRLKLSSKAGLPIDTAYMELSQKYPGLFDPEAHNNVADMLFHMEEVASQLVPVYENPHGYDINSAVEAAENEIVAAVMEGKVPDAKGTMADRMKKRYLEAREADVERITAKANEKYTKYRESRSLTEAKIQLEKTWRQLAQKVLKPTDKKHVPEEMRAAIAAVLENINLESGFDLELGRDAMYHRTEKGRGEPTGRTEAFRTLKKELTRLSEAGTTAVDPDLLGEDGYLEAVIELKDKPLASMTSVEVRLLNRVLREVNAAAENANKLFSGKRWKNVSDAAEEIRTANRKKVEVKNYQGKAGKAKTLLELDMLTPEAYFHRLGQGGDALFQSLRRAQDKQITILSRTAEVTEELTKGYDVRKAEKTLHKVTLGGVETELSTAQIMELYLLMGRKQALDHIATGGLRPEGAVKGQTALERAEPYRGITVGELASAVDKLSEEEIKIADGLREFVSGELAEAGNEASMAVYDIRKFEEKRYWPIKVAGNELVQSPEDRSKSRVTTPANYGMTKQTKPDAKQSVRLGSVFDTFSRHVTEMSTYAAFLAPMEDLNRIRNYQFMAIADNGTRRQTGSMGDIVNRVLGNEGTRYWDQLMEDLSLGISKKGGDRYGAGMIGHFKAAAVGGNLQVVIQQPTAILRACEQISPAYLAQGLARWKSGWKKALKYAPIAQWKDWGYFDINTGRQIKSVFFDTDSKLNKFENALMTPAGMADSFAWGQLWSAAEAETKAERKDLKPESEEFYAHVAERFSEIIDHSQVVDGILQRSQIMRNPDSMSKMATSFMAEPMKQVNQLLSAVYDAVHEQEPKARGKAMKRMVRAGVVLAVSAAANAAVKSLVGALRRAGKDRDKKYGERYLEVLQENLLDGFNPLGYIPFARDTWSIIQGYDVARMDTEVIADLVNATKAVWKAIRGEGTKALTGAGMDLISALAAVTGLPVGNLKREVDGIINSIAVETDNYLLEYELEKISYRLKDGKRYNDILWRALEGDEEQYRLLREQMVRDGLDGEKLTSDMTSRAVDALWKVYSDKKAYNELYAKYLSLGLDNDKLRTGIENKLKKAQNVTSVADLEQRYLPPTEQKAYDEMMGKISGTDVWRSAGADQREKAENLLYELAIGSKTGEKHQEKIDRGAAYGIDETDYVLYQLALSMVDKPTESGKMGTYTNEEVEEAIRMLTGLSDEARGYLWDAQGKSEKSNPWW